MKYTMMEEIKIKQLSRHPIKILIFILMISLFAIFLPYDFYNLLIPFEIIRVGFPHNRLNVTENPFNSQDYIFNLSLFAIRGVITSPHLKNNQMINTINNNSNETKTIHLI